MGKGEELKKNLKITQKNFCMDLNENFRLKTANHVLGSDKLLCQFMTNVGVCFYLFFLEN